MPFERVLASLRIDGEQAKERTPSAGPLAGPSSTDCNPPLAQAPRPELHRAAPVPSIRSVALKGDEMYKGKPLLVFLAACASMTAVLLVVTASAAAATVTQTILSTNESEPFYGGNCGFPLTATFTGEVRMTTIEKDYGSVQLIFTPAKPSTITVTNPANGKTLTSLQVAGEILQISDSS
jgi:hypothetical protein